MSYRVPQVMPLARRNCAIVWFSTAAATMVEPQSVLHPTDVTMFRSPRLSAWSPFTSARNCASVCGPFTLLACVKVNSSIPAV